MARRHRLERQGAYSRLDRSSECPSPGSPPNLPETACPRDQKQSSRKGRHHRPRPQKRSSRTKFFAASHSQYPLIRPLRKPVSMKIETNLSTLQGGKLLAVASSNWPQATPRRPPESTA